MNFSLDRDLLVYEPELFRDVPFLSQERMRLTDAVISGTTLTSIEADFESAGVSVGDVLLVGDQVVEVLARVDATTLTVSLLRGRLSDAAIPPGDAGAQALYWRTFSPQTALVHESLLGLLVTEADEDPVSEDSVLSVSVMTRLETLGTLERVFASAAAVSGENAGLVSKADHYRRAFRSALRQARVLIEVGGVGGAQRERAFARVGLYRA